MLAAASRNACTLAYALWAFAARAEEAVAGCGEIAVVAVPEEAEALSAAVVWAAFCSFTPEICVDEEESLFWFSMFIIIIMLIRSLDELLSPNPLRPLIPYAASMLADDESVSENEPSEET